MQKPIRLGVAVSFEIGMKLKELDSHPLMEAFRRRAASLENMPNETYHLLLPPEYNIPGDIQDACQYLFTENRDSPGIFRQFPSGTFVLKLEGDNLIPQEGFNHSELCEILQSTLCTTTKGFSFDMHEVMINPFCPSPVPPLCKEILDGFRNPKHAIDFLKTRVRSPGLPSLFTAIESTTRNKEIGIDNLSDSVNLLHDAMDRISDLVFEVKPFQFIPTIFKLRTNYIIFYAVANLLHSRLLNAYHASFHEDNVMAQKAMRDPMKSLADPARLNEAALKIRYLYSMPSVQEGIQMVTEFFDMVLNALPCKNAAADDILPAVCDGMSRCAQLSSHLASSFQYLADIWPAEGLDERTTYILVTCSIATSHFASGNVRDRLLPEMQTMREIHVDPEQAKDTIEMLESLLREV